ncbi:MAG: hypothetical protein WKF43_08755 [Acidimicrobiales bacterium]
MTLSPLDDYPIHQAPLSMRHVATSDRNFYDRYYFNCHPCSDELFLVAGLGQYPNLGVVDAFVAVLHQGVHRVVRASKALSDRMDTAVGPIRVEVLEPLHRLRVVCDPNEWGLALDLTWEGAVPAQAEHPHFLRTNERVMFDSMRLAQVGCWSGSIDVEGSRIDVTPDRWWGSRDRSWGIRPVGEAEPPGIAAERPMEGFYWVYAPMQFADCAVLCIVQEEPDGTRVLEQAIRVWPDPARGPERLGRPEIDLVFRPGTTDVESATWHLHEPDGTPLTVEVEPLLPMFIGKGTGYGFDTDWRHGMWQGPLVVQGVRYDLGDPEVAAGLFGIVDAVSRFTASDGRVGHGLFEWLVLGRHHSLDLTG